jgi:hypothetical protein
VHFSKNNIMNLLFEGLYERWKKKEWLTLRERAYEYNHEYGLQLQGRAVQAMRSSDPRSGFIEAFHTLLIKCLQYYREYDNRIIKADPYPVLNAIREVHLLLSQGAHNRYRDIPWRARMEMRVIQSILAQDDMDKYLPAREAVIDSFPEKWMARVDTMRQIQGWGDVSILHFWRLATKGERLLLTIRHDAWAQDRRDQDVAGKWARDLREDVTEYVHSYRAVTGVDLSLDQISIAASSDRYTNPSDLLTRKRAPMPPRRRPGDMGGRLIR